MTVDWDVRVPTRDGTELSANIWHPVPTDDDPDGRFPAILEMIPYGKDNWRRNADTGRGEWFAARGYAFVRVDVRGTGSSAGVALDEYTEVETRDGYDAVEWLAARPWCSGAVGMWGISYGAFTAIQVAKLRPPHLLAIVPVQGTDDRYMTDVHYIGGCVTASELSQYGVSQVAMNAMPPDVGLRGDGWLEEWRTRLELTPPWLITWLRNQTDGPYWRPGSLAPDYDAIDAAILNVGGWCDAYVDSAFRMQARCTAPSRTLVGNWVHGWPQDSIPGPNLDELHEVARFFDRWLKGERNGLDDEPAVVWFERDYSDPEPFPVAWPGRWRATSAFPHPAVAASAWWLDAGGLPQVGRLVDDRDKVSRRPRHLRAPPDRRDSRGAIVGRRRHAERARPRPPARRGPRLDLHERSARDAHLDPGRARGHPPPRRVGAGRDGGRAPDRCRPGRDVVPGQCRDPEPHPPALGRASRADGAGPRGGDPRAAAPRRLSVRARASRPGVGRVLGVAGRVAVAVARELRAASRPGDAVAARAARDPGRGWCRGPAGAGVQDRRRRTSARSAAKGAWDTPAWRIEEDVIAGTVTVTIHDGGEDVLEDGRRLYAAETLRLTASDKDPASARLEADVVYRWHEIAHDIEIRARSLQTSDAEAFDLSVALEVDLDGERLFERAWQERIPRHLV